MLHIKENIPPPPWHAKDRFAGFLWRVGSSGPPGQFQNWSHFTNSRCRYMAEIFPIRRKTLSNQSFNLMMVSKNDNIVIDQNTEPHTRLSWFEILQSLWSSKFCSKIHVLNIFYIAKLFNLCYKYGTWMNYYFCTKWFQSFG